LRRALRPLLSFAAAILTVWACAGAEGVRAQGARPLQLQTVAVHFDAQGSAGTRFGRLLWRGGVEIRSADAGFGGYSGLVVSPHGMRLLAVSDRGRWLAADMLYEDGMLAGVSNARTADVLGTDGAPLRGKNRRDAEGLAPATPAGIDGPVLMALERDERILRFDFGLHGFDAVPSLIPLPDEAALGPFNKELEALAVLDSAGTLIAISERNLDDAGNIRGWLISDEGAQRVSLARSHDFDVTDATALPGGDILVLERRLSPLMRAGMRLRRIAGADIVPGATLQGEVLLEADQPRHAIDNMEAVAVHVDAHGGVRLTLMSDDNFNPLQRTLLLQFELPR